MAGEWDVGRIARGLTAKQFQEWEHYAQLEPFGELRADYRAASIREMVHNTQVKKEHQKPLKDFLLNFEEQEPKKKQDWRAQVKILELLAMAHNAPGVSEG